MWTALPGIVDELTRDITVRAIVFRGAGEEAFASGADISEFKEQRKDRATAEAYNARTSAAYMAMEHCPKPTIAMIHGYCMGGAVAIALACDLRFSADTGKFAIPAARLGIVYGLHSVKRLVSLVGPAMAKDILFSARRWTPPRPCASASSTGGAGRRAGGPHVRVPGPGRRQRADLRPGGEAHRRGHRRRRRRRPAGRDRPAPDAPPSRARTTGRARPPSWRSGGPSSSAGSPARARGAPAPRRALPRSRDVAPLARRDGSPRPRAPAARKRDIPVGATRSGDRARPGPERGARGRRLRGVAGGPDLPRSRDRRRRRRVQRPDAGDPGGARPARAPDPSSSRRRARAGVDRQGIRARLRRGRGARPVAVLHRCRHRARSRVDRARGGLRRGARGGAPVAHEPAADRLAVGAGDPAGGLRPARPVVPAGEGERSGPRRSRPPTGSSSWSRGTSTKRWAVTGRWPARSWKMSRSPAT